MTELKTILDMDMDKIESPESFQILKGWFLKDGSLFTVNRGLSPKNILSDDEITVQVFIVPRNMRAENNNIAQITEDKKEFIDRLQNNRVFMDLGLMQNTFLIGYKSIVTKKFTQYTVDDFLKQFYNAEPKNLDEIPKDLFCLQEKFKDDGLPFIQNPSGVKDFISNKLLPSGAIILGKPKKPRFGITSFGELKIRSMEDVLFCKKDVGIDDNTYLTYILLQDFIWHITGLYGPPPVKEDKIHKFIKIKDIIGMLMKLYEFRDKDMCFDLPILRLFRDSIISTRFAYAKKFLDEQFKKNNNTVTENFGKIVFDTLLREINGIKLEFFRKDAERKRDIKMCKENLIQKNPKIPRETAEMICSTLNNVLTIPNRENIPEIFESILDKWFNNNSLLEEIFKTINSKDLCFLHDIYYSFRNQRFFIIRHLARENYKFSTADFEIYKNQIEECRSNLIAIPLYYSMKDDGHATMIIIERGPEQEGQKQLLTIEHFDSSHIEIEEMKEKVQFLIKSLFDKDKFVFEFYYPNEICSYPIQRNFKKYEESCSQFAIWYAFKRLLEPQKSRKTVITEMEGFFEGKDRDEAMISLIKTFQTLVNLKLSYSNKIGEFKINDRPMYKPNIYIDSLEEAEKKAKEAAEAENEKKAREAETTISKGGRKTNRQRNAKNKFYRMLTNKETEAPPQKGGRKTRSRRRQGTRKKLS